MSKYERNETLLFASTGFSSAPAAPINHGSNCQLEYLDLTDAEARNNPVVSHTEAEFYSFDDYLPTRAIHLEYENIYTDNNNKFPSIRLSHPSSGYQSDILPVADQLVWQRDGTLQETQSCAYSTCSGSSVSSQSSYPSSISREEFARSNLARTLEKASLNGNFSFSQSLSSSRTHTTYENMNSLMSKSLSTDSFRRLASGHQLDWERPKNNGFLSASIPDYTKAKSDNQLSNRTEALLDGIVKLAVNDVIADPSKEAQRNQASRTQNKMKETLKSSQSSPHLSASISQSQSSESNRGNTLKPSSPSASSSKRFAVSRKNSFNSQNASESEKKVEKRNKSSEKSYGTTQVNAFLHAVEHFDIEKVSSLISSDSTCVNSVTDEGLTALDIAVLTNHVPMIKLLTKRGAQTKFLDEQRDNNLCNVLQEFISGAEEKVVQMRSSSGKDSEKKLNQWEFKHRLFRRMKTGYEQAGLASQPQNVRLSVTSDSSLHVRFDAPDGSNGAIVTRYKVEWSKSQNFRPLAGEVIINEIHSLEHAITGLDSGVPYYVKVTAWNIKGFGRSSLSDPLYAIPSSWRDVENFESRTSNYKLHRVHDVLENFGNSRRSDGSVIRAANTNSHLNPDSPTYNRKGSAPPLIRGLRGLFSSSFKFQKSLKRGVYLAAVCYCDDDKILTTTEDNLPIVEVDESYSGTSLQLEFDWLMKVVAASWDTVRQLKQELEKLSELSSAHLKHQLLAAVLQLQEMMGMQELGKLFYKPINDGNGSIVLAIVNQLTDQKQIGSIASSLKWQSQSKLMKNCQPADPLLPLLNEMIFFHQVSLNRVQKGLYLGYLHIKIANAESIKVLAPENHPSVLPFMRIRDCSNVSRSEWRSLLDLGLSNKANTKPQADSAEIISFKKQLMKAAKKLANKLDLSSDLLGEHRFYDVEVLDFSKDVSFILLLPPRDLVCSGFKSQANSETGDGLESSSEYMEIPVKAFEMLHLHTYQPAFITDYSKAATTIDTQLALAQLSQREAFSNEEIETSRKQLESSRLQQQQLEEIWRSTRWLMDAITYARDKAAHGVTVTCLYGSIYEQLSSNTTLDCFGRSSDDGYHSDKISLGGGSSCGKPSGTYSRSQTCNTNNNNGQYYDGELDYHHQPAAATETLEPGILRVYAAYSCGLARGTSVILHVTIHTTAREVINLVVRQLNQAVVAKNFASPIYNESSMQDFCLVAVIGPRERVLRDDYKVLQLQNPWTKGKLFVRLKRNLLAALEQGETTNV